MQLCPPLLCLAIATQISPLSAYSSQSCRLCVSSYYLLSSYDTTIFSLSVYCPALHYGPNWYVFRALRLQFQAFFNRLTDTLKSDLVQIAAGALAITELVSFSILRSTQALQTDAALPVSAMSFIAALCITFVIDAEHRRALQASALTGIYLLVTFLADLARANNYFSRPQAQALTCLAVLSAGLKLSLLLLLEISKRGQIADPHLRENVSEEAVSGFWSRSFLVWLHTTLFLGFQRIITVDDLGALGPEFSSKLLSNRLEFSLRHGMTELCILSRVALSY